MPWIDKCITSVMEQSHVIVIDNNSSDGTPEYISTTYPDVILIKNTSNQGFGRANNMGMSYALEHNADYVFLLNQDAYTTTEALENLITVSSEHPEYGILSPLQLSGSETIDLMFSHYLLDNQDYYYDLSTNGNLKEIYSYPFLNAAAWLIPANTLKEIGGFDPIFFHYGEDENYCQRTLFHDLKIGLVPKAVIVHDRPQYLKTEKELFSEAYFKAFEKHVKVIYANPNHNHVTHFWKHYKSKYLKKAFRALLSLKISHVKGYLIQHKHLIRIYNDIETSKSITKTLGKHYL